MEKLKSSLTNMAVVLTVIAVVAGGVLAAVNAITAPQIEKINTENLANGIKEVMGQDNVNVKDPQEIKANVGGKEKTYVVYAVEDQSGAPLGTAVQSSENGFGGELQVLTGFDQSGTILGYKVLQHAETPGLGAKAGRWFQKDNGEKRTVVGKTPGQCNFTVSKDGGDIDAITASTITSRAFLAAIQNAYSQVYGNGDAQTGASTKNKQTTEEKTEDHE